ncbi:MAG: glycosyltransferase [Chthoniobacterales bacterium]
MNRAAICIAGAHRSGTSMLTRLLHEAGLELGPERDMMPAQTDNPDGFWENLRFVAINDEVLNELGGAWDLPPAAGEDFNDARLQPLQLKAKLLIESFAHRNIWGWKDPRNSLTLPFWRSLLPDLKVVVMVRNPLEVAYSLRKRNGTSYAFGLRLWELYCRRLLATTTPQERLITDYNAFFANPESELRRVAGFIGLPDEKIGAAATLVAKGRRHTTFTVDQLIDARVTAEIVDLYRRLIGEGTPEERAQGQAAVAPDIAKSAKPAAELLPGLANRLRVSVPEGENVRKELASLRGTKQQLDDLRAEVRHREELARRDEQIRARDEQIRKLAGQIEELRAVSTAHERARQAEIEALRDRFIQTNQLLHARSISLTEHEARVIELTARLRRQLHATKRLSTLLDDVKTAAARLASSRRWKMANPLAALKSLISSKRAAGYGHLDKIIDAYAKWKAKHPEAQNIIEALQELTPRARFEPSSGTTEKKSQRWKPRTPIEHIQFTTNDKIEISIIIPVFNQFHFTQGCLASLQEYAGDEQFEVIVVDDCSTDATAKMIPKVPGLVYLRNESNAGFIASCNRGAAEARGPLLFFLNNDTEITPGSLTALRETFEREQDVGLVGSKLIYPDGRLQEAGGIIWRDGTGWNRGKFDDPGKPEYNYLCETDYCSGASIMIPKALFKRLGGFDAKYAPAYYEDVDLAFKLRQAGYKILYQPLSEVIHFEGATGGTDTSAGAKKYQEVNRAAFVQTWADVLSDKPENGDLASLGRLAAETEHILVIDHHLPMPDRDAGSLRMFNILLILHRLGHRVTFVPDNLADIPPYAEELQKRGVEVLCHPYIKSIRAYLEEKGYQFDTVILSRCDFARKHIADVRRHAPQSRVIFDTVDLHFLRQRREADLARDPSLQKKAEEKQLEEYRVIEQADETWVVSDFELELLRSELPDSSIELMSMIVDVPGSATPFSLRHDYLFIGSFQHTPNIDAVLFFVNEVYPLVRQSLPEANFYVIGDKAPPSVIALASEKVIVTGPLPDVKPYFDTVKLSIAPLRYGAGVKGKINQSMGLGVPVVATSLAAEGMSLTHRHEILIADDPQAFAAALIELYQSEELWLQVSNCGLAKTRTAYSDEAATIRLSQLFRKSRPYAATRTARPVEPVSSGVRADGDIAAGRTH